MSHRLLTPVLPVSLCLLLWTTPAHSGFMGVYLEKVPDEQVLRIMDIIENSPAQAADLKAGDIITHIANIPIDDVNQCIAIIRDTNVGDEMSVLILRGDKRMEIRVRLTFTPDPSRK